MPTDLVVPALGESISEAVIGKWLKKVGDATAPDEPVVDLETDKVSVQLPSPAGGVLVEQRFAEGATVKVGEVIGRIDETSAGKVAKPVAAPAPAAAAVPVAAAAAAPVAAPVAAAVPVAAAEPPPPDILSPAQRKYLREHGDVPAAPKNGPTAAPVPVPAPVPAAPRAPTGTKEDVVAMTPMRKRIAERLVQAQHTSASLTTFNEVDMSTVMALRARLQDAFVAKHGVKLGFMSFFVKAAVEALKDFPMVNAEIRGTDIVYKKHYDIGIAVGSGKGLVVPVLRGADQLGFAEVEKGIAALASKVKDSKITLEDLQGGTFTITNGGIYGSMMSTPLLNFPQSGILGMHNIVKRAMVIDDQVTVRPMMYVALTYDHRLVDGREAVQFLVGIKERIESPEKILFSI
jgi:2-oxoglutarate dehydrogenase E2 component (dihydrolipoamide succinyltransferase)